MASRSLELAPGSEVAAAIAPGGGVGCEAIAEDVGDSDGTEGLVGPAVAGVDAVGVGFGAGDAKAGGAAKPLISPTAKRDSPTVCVRDVSFIALPA
jgi:hypothetical protein